MRPDTLTGTRSAERGFVLVPLLPWVLAVAGAAATIVALQRPPAVPPAPEAPGGDSARLRTLRLAVATAASQNAALRGELDRLLMRDDVSGSNGGGESPGARFPGQPGSAGLSDGAGELSRRIREILADAASGDPDAAEDAARSLRDVSQGSREGLAALQDAYRSAVDPRERLTLMPAILSGGSQEAREFLVEQIRTEPDPDLRDALVQQAAGFATPLHAEELKETFLTSASEPGADEDVRSAALRGLRYAKGPAVEELLLSSISDRSEEVRLAAIEGLVSRPERHEELQSVLDREPSPRVREVGSCRLLLTRPTR